MAGTHQRRTKSGKVVTVRNPTRRRHNAMAAPQRKAAQRKTKASGRQLQAGFKFGKGGQIVKDTRTGRTRKRRISQL